jgi:hypothetical protein
MIAKGITSYGVRTTVDEKPESDVAGSSLPPKSWKKHNNRNKREKLRRVYADLDRDN